MIHTYYRQPYPYARYELRRSYQPYYAVEILPQGVEQLGHDRQAPAVVDLQTTPWTSESHSEEPIPVWQPPIAVAETPTQFTLQIELPGVPAADINLEATQQTLRIYGERRRPATTGHGRSEFHYGPFARTVQFGVAIDPHGITSDRQAGIITLTIPKAAAQQPQTVKVTVATPTPTITAQAEAAPGAAGAAPVAETVPTVIHLPSHQTSDPEEDPWVASA
ncbi:Hsp20/alpha crystallin family protein [Trichothermofontia sichuanensis B231]|uniref:Hsp20/alpha crystallin family protein n=1 Tax=Trichothermofontia sichuanensis TaxID=3045816 RepID=UPI0022459F65|nr:Hsp20/alpha crystallin family protein [Trichothermofontia sichuanensis]UZQ55807.1 Hsp20/alpha crystallin family protein [Trichothermofontia sichuanensis B231]